MYPTIAMIPIAATMKPISLSFKEIFLGFRVVKMAARAINMKFTAVGSEGWPGITVFAASGESLINKSSVPVWSLKRVEKNNVPIRRIIIREITGKGDLCLVEFAFQSPDNKIKTDTAEEKSDCRIKFH